MYEFMAMQARLALPPVAHRRVLTTNCYERGDVLFHHHSGDANTSLDTAESGTFVPEKVSNIEHVSEIGEKLTDLVIGDVVREIEQAYFYGSILHQNTKLVHLPVKHELVLVIMFSNNSLCELQVVDLYEGASQPPARLE